MTTCSHNIPLENRCNRCVENALQSITDLKAKYNKLPVHVEDKPVPAKNTTGFILWTGENYFFRVYQEDGKFADFDIHHCDLEVNIVSDDAYFYPPNSVISNGNLDYDPGTLGK